MLFLEKLPLISQDQDASFDMFEASVGAQTHISYSAKDRLK